MEAFGAMTIARWVVFATITWASIPLAQAQIRDAGSNTVYRNSVSFADGAEKIGRLHVAEALSYRALAEDLRRAA
jgi:hypothetical protein